MKQVNSIIVGKDGNFKIAETLQQIREQSQQGNLLSLYCKESDGEKFYPVLFNADGIELVVDASDMKEKADSESKGMSESEKAELDGDEFLKGFASYLYNKFHDEVEDD